MWTGDKAIYDILTLAGVNKNQLQSFIDKGKEMYNKLETPGFPFRRDMQTNFSFEQLEAEYGINAMATYVDIDSPGTPINYESAVLSTGKIPRQKKRADFDEVQYRQKLELGAVTGDITDSALGTLFESTKKLIDSHTNAMTYQRHQMVSCGQFETTDENNPGGIVGRLYKANIPGGNITSLTGTARWWTDNDHTVEGSAANPVKNLQDVEFVAKKKGRAMHWEVDENTMEETLNHSKVKALIGTVVLPLGDAGQQAAQVEVTPRERRLEIFKSFLRYPVTVVDSISSVDKTNPKTKKVENIEFRSFNPDAWALVPNGKIGEILTVAPFKINPSERSAYADYYGGRLLMTVDFDLLKKIQYMETEMTSLVVPDKPKLMYILNIR
mgnify:CR=1 FL=1